MLVSHINAAPRLGMIELNSKLTLRAFSGSYIYLQADNPAQKRNLVGILESEFFSSSTKERCLEFWGHMSGKEMGTLQVNVTYYDEVDPEPQVCAKESQTRYLSYKILTATQLMLFRKNVS